MTFRLLFLTSIAVLALGAPCASAQTPAKTPAPATPAGPAPAAVGATSALPANACVKPEFPGRLASSTRASVFNKELKAYGDCIKKYLEDLRAITNAATAAGNSAIDDYNAFQAELKAKIDEAKPD
ncbi:MAG: hypothetical protein ACHP7M_02660 [Burkholderiales bacterium]|jgi:hypothetical protein